MEECEWQTPGQVKSSEQKKQTKGRQKWRNMNQKGVRSNQKLTKKVSEIKQV
jgi:hypothetical protein